MSIEEERIKAVKLRAMADFEKCLDDHLDEILDQFDERCETHKENGEYNDFKTSLALVLRPDKADPAIIIQRLDISIPRANINYRGKTSSIMPGQQELDFTSPEEAQAAADGEISDEQYEEGKKHILDTQRASASNLIRAMKITPNQALSILDRMEQDGLIGGPVTGTQSREILADAD